MENNNIPSEIPADREYVVIDSRSGEVLYRTTYANRKRARSFADRKDNAYGAVICYCKLN
jgi:hypothetical protein